MVNRADIRKNSYDDTDNKGTSKLSEEVYSEIGRTSKTELFLKTVSDWNPLSFSEKDPTTDI